MKHVWFDFDIRRWRVLVTMAGVRMRAHYGTRREAEAVAIQWLALWQTHPPQVETPESRSEIHAGWTRP